MADAALALDLLCCDEHDRAADLARRLDAHNAERRREEERIVEEARVQAEACLADPGPWFWPERTGTRALSASWLHAWWNCITSPLWFCAPTAIL